MTDRFEQLVAEAEATDVSGWDFSWLDGRATEQRPSWGYQRLMAQRLAAVTAALDVQDGRRCRSPASRRCSAFGCPESLTMRYGRPRPGRENPAPTGFVTSSTKQSAGQADRPGTTAFGASSGLRQSRGCGRSGWVFDTPVG
jgi:hypothetical protein